MNNPLITDPLGLLVVLLLVPTLIFSAESNPLGSKVFKIIPSLVFAYFVPTALSSLGIIPADAPLYKIIKDTVLPASLILLTLAVDLNSILKLGPKALLMFFAGTTGVILGAPLALFLFQGQLPPDIWKGMAALSGSWIGGGVNFIAVGNAVGATDTMMGMMVVVDVAVASLWMGFLIYLGGRYQKIDAYFGVDNSAVEEIRQKITAFQISSARVGTTLDYLLLFSLAFGATWICGLVGNLLPELGGIISHGTWKIILVTTVGLALSFTRASKLEGAGASKLGTLFLYLLIGVIGASADLAEVFKYPALFGMGLVWIFVHIVLITLAMRVFKAPVFLMAVGSQANIGAAASASIVASAFHPALMTVGVLLGVFSYVVGTYGALLCAVLLKWVAGV